jgi:hypothetical protein
LFGFRARREAANEGNNYRDNLKTNLKTEKQELRVITDEATDYFLSFAFSIGLCKRLEHPELISFGLTTDRLNSFI